MATLWIDGLCKKYPAFYLDHVTFEVGEGKIMGFVGRNGAGKTTTIKSLFNYVHPDEGEVYFFGLNFRDNEAEIKSRVGYVGSDASIPIGMRRSIRTACAGLVWTRTRSSRSCPRA